MEPRRHSVIVELPSLPDELAVLLLDSLYEFVCAWENCYAPQIRRHYDKLEKWTPPGRACEREQQLNLFDENDLPPF